MRQDSLSFSRFSNFSKRLARGLRRGAGPGGRLAHAAIAAARPEGRARAGIPAEWADGVARLTTYVAAPHLFALPGGS